MCAPQVFPGVARALAQWHRRLPCDGDGATADATKTPTWAYTLRHWLALLCDHDTPPIATVASAAAAGVSGSSSSVVHLQREVDAVDAVMQTMR